MSMPLNPQILRASWKDRTRHSTGCLPTGIEANL
jgi:hypothetical protein